MPPISLGGAFSKLPPNIVEQIMAAERIPVRNMENKKVGINAKLELVNDLDGRMRKLAEAVKELFGTKGFQDYALNLSREGIIAGSVDPEAAKTGSWRVEVMQLPENAGTMTNGFPDRDRTQMGVGYLKFRTQDGTKEVYINDSNNTLDGIAAAVNSADVGVNASVIRDADADDYPYKLIFSGDGFGEDDSVEFPTVYLLDGDHDFYFDEERESKNGRVKVNGFEIYVEEKKLENLIPGVTLDLLSAEPGREVVVSVNEDFEVIQGKITDFVASINEVLKFIQAQNAMNENTDTSKTLGGDSMLRSVEGRMRRLIQGGFFTPPGQGEINRLAQLGIEFNRNGTVDFKEDKFDATLRANPQGVLKFLRGDGSQGSGFIGKVRQLVAETTRQFGVINNRKRGLENRIKRIDQNIENKERVLARKEQGLRRKFAKLEENLSRLQGQGQALGAIGGGGGGALGGLL